MQPRLPDKRRLRSGARFDETVGNFMDLPFEVKPPEKPRDVRRPRPQPRPDLVVERFRGMAKINAKFDETVCPEEVVAVHNYGFIAAHTRRVRSVQNSFDKQWDDMSRVRGHISRRRIDALEPPRRVKDRCILERVALERNEAREESGSQSARQTRRRRVFVSRRDPLPREDRACPNSARRLYYYGS